MFTRQHYYNIGAIIARIPDKKIRNEQIEMYVNLFSGDNPNFKPGRFRDYVQDVVDELT